MSKAEGAAIIRRFRGLYDTGRSVSDLPGLEGRFDFLRPRADKGRRETTESLVISTAGQLHRFIDRIPEKVMDCVPCPGPSADPLLQRPSIDFDIHMVLAIISHDPNRFIEAEIVDVERTPEALRVLCRFPEPGPVVPKIISYGTYCAVVVGRFEGEVIFVPVCWSSDSPVHPSHR